MTSFQASDSALLYHAHHARHPEDLPFWLALAEQFDGPVLELGCGTGRVLLALARAGHKVRGVDNDPEMLEVLRGLWPAEMGDAPVEQADFTHLAVTEKFGLAILPCNTYSTLAPSERRSLLTGLAGVIRPGGIFAVSMPNLIMLRELPKRAALEVEERFPHPVHGAEVEVSSGWQRNPTQFTIQWRYAYEAPEGEKRRVDVEVRHWLTPVDRLMEEFAEAGFNVMGVYGGYEGEAFVGESEQLIVVMERPAHQKNR